MFRGIGLAVVFYFYTRKVDPQQQLLALFYCITGVFLAPHTRIKKDSNSEMAPNLWYKLHVTKQPRVVGAGMNLRWMQYRDSNRIICNFESLTGRYL
jgi:hypothetical protein